MLNIHSTEILLILIVALVVIGPERLPAAIKTAGLWIGRFRRSFYKVKAEIERELNADEIRRQLHNESVMADIEEAKSKVEGIAKDTETSVNKLVSTANFDPGASKATAEQAKEEKSIGEEIKEEIKEAGEQFEKTAKQIYAGGTNPRLTLEQEPSVEGKPIADQKPSAEKTSSAGKKPSARKKPTANKKPSAAKQPSGGKKPPAKKAAANIASKPAEKGSIKEK